jgi:probable HAF family extracellular repeat protein
MSCDSDLALAAARGKRATRQLRFVLFSLVLVLAMRWVRIPTPVEAQEPAAPGPSDVKSVNPTFTTIDVPGDWGVTGVSGINSFGNMVGIYAKNNGGAGVHSFELVDGTFSYFDYPGAYGTFAGGINDSGTIVGYAESNGGLTAQGFFYDGTTFTPFQDGHLPSTLAMSLDNGGDVVGGKGDPGSTRGFEMRSGKFKNLSPPPSGQWVYVYATAINSLGEVVGWTDYDGFDYGSGRYQTISFPGAAQTEAHGVNDSGIVVGWYLAESCACGFALVNGHFLSFGYPGATGTFPSAINASGQVVGSYTFDYQTFHGFVTSPITITDFDER